MARVEINKQAREDLDEIEAYFEEVNPDFARSLDQGIRGKIRQLQRFPYIGRMVPEIGKEWIRELIYRRYRIIYFVDESGGEVEVLRIRHSSRQFGGLPGESE